MAVLQAYQADLLGDIDRSEGVSPDEIRELRRATDLSLRATKETARAIGRSMAALVATPHTVWQFGSPPPRYNGVLLTLVHPEQALVMEQEVESLLAKGAIEQVYSPDRESGFYSRYFIVPKKDGGLRPILDLRLLNQNHFPWCGMGFSHDAGHTIARSCSCYPRSHERVEARPVTHCETVRETVGSSGESPPGRNKSTASSTTLAESNLVCGPNSSPRRPSLGDPNQERPSVSGRGHNISPPAGDLETMGLASEGAQLIESGLSTEVVETILSSRAPATRKLYTLKWRVFTSWCHQHQRDPVNCSVNTVLEFLQYRFSSGSCPSTLKVYVAAIAALHAPVGSTSLGRDPLIIRFLRGTLRLRPATRTRVPAWDLAIVLEGLSGAPFEPLESVSEKFLTFKTIFLLAISSLKRVGDLQALSVSPTCLEFAPGMVKAFLYPKQGYVPKVPTNIPRPIVLQAFYPPPFASLDQEKLNLLCPVRALDTYLHRAAQWRRSDQLFVCFGSPKKGLQASKQTISKWIVEAISLAYESSGLPCPLAVRAHSTRSMAASKALLSGVSLQEVCDAAGWSSPLTFVRFYSLDLEAASGSQVLLT
ncbi:hypothetical protein PO909_005809 [Leuciscus waleckii]